MLQEILQELNNYDIYAVEQGKKFNAKMGVVTNSAGEIRAI